MSEPDSDPADELTFSVLNAYLEDLHSGREPDRDRLLAQHPQLASAVDCLDAVDCLAVRAAQLANAGDSDPRAPTLSFEPAANLAPSLTADRVLDVQRAFGDFELLAEIGRGGMGVVYRARQKSLERIVAIKTILFSHLASEAQVQRFYQEARAAARVKHPNIVEVHGVGELYGQHYLVMEFMPGGSLAEVVERGPVDPETAARWLVPIARALDHLHRQGVVHCDLKPSNILLDQAGEPHVADFGLAKMLAADSGTTQTGDVVGTPSYMAPEQAAGRRRDVGPRSDVYSLGAVLYALVTSRPPFRAPTTLDTLVQVVEREPTLPSQMNPQLPRDLEMIVMRCLQKSPDARYASAGALADDLERFLKREAVEAQPPGLWQRLKRWTRREPALVSRLALLTLCFCIEWISFFRGHIEQAFFETVAVLLATWGLASAMYQRLLTSPRWGELIRFAWAGTDVLLITALLIVTDGLESPLVIAYPALVGAAGLWFRARLVTFATVMATVSYFSLILYWEWVGPGLREPLQRHVISMLILLVLGFVVSYQVKRVRALSRYYEHRPLP